MTTSLKYSSTLISSKESLGNNFVTKLPVTESSHVLSFRMDPVSFSSGPGSSYESQSFLVHAGECCKSAGAQLQVFLVASGGKGCVGHHPESPPGG